MIYEKVNHSPKQAIFIWRDKCISFL